MILRNGQQKIGAVDFGRVEFTRQAALMSGARVSADTSYRAAAAAQGKTLAPDFVQGPAFTDEGGIPRPVLIGAGVVGVLALAAVAYKLTR